MKRIVFAFLILSLLLPLSCKKEKKNTYVPPPLPKVTVQTPEIKDVTLYLNLTGRTAAIEKVDIVARVKGFLEKIHFKDGDMVKKGDLLYTIDAREYIAALHKAEADLLKAKSSLTFAKNDLDRREKAFKEHAVSELDYLRAKAEYDKAKAAVAAAQAKVEEARLNLSFTKIYSPINGKASMSLVDKGNLVGASGPTLLTTIVSLDPIHAYFNLNERDVARYLRRASEKATPKNIDKIRPKKKILVDLALATEEGYPHQGKLDYVDNRVDANTGTLQARAVFPNKDLTIIPGFFAKIRIPISIQKNALLVPERAIGLDQVGPYVLVVGPDDKVVRKDIKIGPKIGIYRLVQKGLQKEDRVIIEGILFARPGEKVQPVAPEVQTKEKHDKSIKIPNG